MTEEKKAALRRFLEGFDRELVVLKHYVNIWPGADVSRERDKAEELALKGQAQKIKALAAEIEASVSRLFNKAKREPHPKCTICNGHGWYWGGERGEKPEDCDCDDAYLEDGAHDEDG